MTLDLDKLECLEREATPGPWRYSDDHERLTSELYPILSEHMGYYHMEACRFADWRLIAEVRNALPELLSYVRRLERVAEAARKAAEIIEGAADADPYIMPLGSADELKEALADL